MENFNINNISSQGRQFELFDSTSNISTNLHNSKNITFDSKSLMKWRNKIFDHQSKILEDSHNIISQPSIIPETNYFDKTRIDPFSLQPLTLNFWRANQYVHDGPAMYFVIDNMINSKIVLYIGETNSANKRWKGEHDCKN